LEEIFGSVAGTGEKSRIDHIEHQAELPLILADNG